MSVLFGNKAVTVYNRHFDTKTEEEIWLPTLLKKVNLSVTKGANKTQSGIENADSCKLYVDVSEQDKEYLSPKKWESQALDEKKTSFTFQQDTTFFVEGDTSGIEILDSRFLEYMMKHHDKVFVVTTVDEYTDVMPHIEVGGK